MKTVVVIGSNSFSGADFIDLLLETGKYKVIGISRSTEKADHYLPFKRHGNDRYRFVQMDLNGDLSQLKHILENDKPNYVVNFAAQSEVGPSWENPDHWFQTNSVAITRLANLLKNYPIERYVHISSPEVYGTCEGLLKESAPMNPSTPYAASKAAGDFSLFTFFKNYQFPLVMVRATNVYGPAQQLFKIIPRTIVAAKAGQVIDLHGGGVAVKSYIYIRDVSRGELAVMEKGRPGEIYHFSPHQGIAVRDVMQHICNSMGVAFESLTRVVAERLGQDKAYLIDSSKAREEFGWRDEVSMSEGIEMTKKWVMQNWDAVSQEPLRYIHRP